LLDCGELAHIVWTAKTIGSPKRLDVMTMTIALPVSGPRPMSGQAR